jgi:hypothetical protein
MFLRSTNRKKDGKDHRYFSVVENRRLPGGQTVQRTVLYLGEIHDQQQAAWRKTLEVFDEDQKRYTSLSLFPEDREIPEDALDSVQVNLSGLELRRPRVFGHCWLACQLWQQLGLDAFWQARLPEAREAVSWEKVLRQRLARLLRKLRAMRKSLLSGPTESEGLSPCKTLEARKFGQPRPGGSSAE